MVAWLVGNRDAETAAVFMEDLASRLKQWVLLTTDGHGAYLDAVEGAFDCDINYGALIKLYGSDPEGQKRYSPSSIKGTKRENISGKPDPAHVSMSYAERQNLTVRMSMRRFTRVTNAFSKKVGNLAHAVSLRFTYYNVGRIHKSLRVTPAMAAAITDPVWSLEEIANLTDGTVSTD